MYQMTIFDIIKRTVKDIPCGYIKEEDETALVGRELSFTELKNMIGKKCIVSATTESRRWYKVIKIIDYFEGCDKIYKQVRELPENDIGYGERVNDFIHDVVGIKDCMDCYEVDYVCDRVAYTNKDNSKKAEGWVSESWCSGGRFKPLDGPTEGFFELLGI